MAKAVNPRHGSMQFWPRKRAKRVYARVRSWSNSNETKLLGFAGYKVGMTHVAFIDDKKTSVTKGQEINCPVTIIECPPLKPLSLRFYKQTHSGLKLIAEIFSNKIDKNLKRKYAAKIKNKTEDIKDFDDLRLVVYTQPSLTGIGKKKPEIFELGIGGNKDDKLNYAKGALDKEIKIDDILKAGQFVDVHGVTKGKGFQGAVKRFGIGLTSHKSEKSRRTPGSLGPWKGQTHIMYRVAHAGQTGYHVRTKYNNWIVAISDKIEDINRKAGFIRYGLVKNPYVLVKGSVPGPAKRLIKLTLPIRNKEMEEAPNITYTRK